MQKCPTKNSKQEQTSDTDSKNSFKGHLVSGHAQAWPLLLL